MSHPTRDVVRSLTPDERLVLSGSLYFSEDDYLRLDALNSVASVTLELTGLLINPAGDLKPFRYVQTPTADRVVTTSRFHLGEGFLIHATVRVTAGTVARGQCYVTVMAQWQSGTGGIVFSTLIADYASALFSPVWPGGVEKGARSSHGVFRTITDADPAAGAEAILTVPTGALWLVYSFRTQLVTSSVAATRVARLNIDDGTNTFHLVNPTVTQAASLTKNYNAGNYPVWPATDADQLAWHLPSPVYLRPAGRVRTITALIDTGDNYSAPIAQVEEWIDD